MDLTDLNAIKARLGSISDIAMSKLPKAVQTLLQVDLPRLIKIAECAESECLIIPAQLYDEMYL